MNTPDLTGKKVTLISVPWYSPERKPAYLSHNLGLGYIAAVLERAGCGVTVIDGVANHTHVAEKVEIEGRTLYRVGMPYSEIAAAIPRETDWIGVSVPFTFFARIFFELAEEIKRARPDTPLAAGGVFPSTLPETALESAADYIVRGEGELALPLLISGAAPEKIPGVHFARGGAPLDGGVAQAVVDLDTIPFPARHLFPVDRYLTWSPRGSRKPTLSLFTSRGCPFNCRFCSIHAVNGYKWRFRSPDNVIAEILHVREKYGVETIEFEDDNLTLNRARALELFDRIAALNAESRRPISWSTPNGLRTDTLDEDIIRAIRKSGCDFIALAVESGDPDTLKAMNKKLSLDKVRDVIRSCGRNGIRTSAFMIVGYPGETRRRYVNSLNYFMELKSIGLSSVAVHILKPYPGTEVFDYCREKGYLTNDNPVTVLWLESKFRLFRNQVGVVTEDFDRKEVLWRRNHAYKTTNPKTYYAEKIAASLGIRALIERIVPRFILNRLKKLLR